MADRTTPKFYEGAPRGGSFDTASLPIADTVRVAIGTLIQMEGGYANHWDDGASSDNDRFMGICYGGDTSANAKTDDPSSFLGDTSGDPDPDPECRIDISGRTIRKIAVEGASAQTDVGALIFCDDSDLDNVTIQTSGRENAIGKVTRFHTATSFDIKLFTPMEYIAHTLESPGS